MNKLIYKASGYTTRREEKIPLFPQKENNQTEVREECDTIKKLYELRIFLIRFYLLAGFVPES